MPCNFDSKVDFGHQSQRVYLWVHDENTDRHFTTKLELVHIIFGDQIAIKNIFDPLVLIKIACKQGSR